MGMDLEGNRRVLTDADIDVWILGDPEIRHR